MSTSVSLVYKIKYNYSGKVNILSSRERSTHPGFCLKVKTYFRALKVLCISLQFSTDFLAITK